MKKLLLSVILLSFGIISYGQIYVNENASGANNGSSWADAYTDLHNALFTSPHGSEIWVAQGTYTPSRTYTGNIAADSRDHTFRIVNNIQVYGGFNGTETSLNQRDWKTNPTVISGDLGTGLQARNVIRLDGNSNSTIIDGFIVENGEATTGTLLHGGAIYSINASPTIKNCTFQNNTSQQHGGAIYTNGGEPHFYNCKMINNNTMQYDGGALYIQSASTTNIVNCLFDGNEGRRYGGAIVVQNTPTAYINNCTFVNNTFVTGSANAIFLSVTTGSPTLYINNTAFYNNGPSSYEIERNGGACFVANCYSDYGTTGFYYTNGLTNIITGNPFFTDYNNSDYSILCKSPLANAGDTTGIVYSNLDLNGDVRVFGSNIDVGAFENNVNEIGVEANKTTICNGEYVILRGTCDATGYTWNNGVTDGIAFYPTTTQTYTCTGTATGDTAQITIEVINISDENITAPTTVCKGSNTTITLANSSVGASYFLRKDTTDIIIDGPIIGNGSNINFTTNEIYSTSSYNVYADVSPSITNIDNFSVDFDGSNDKITTNFKLPNSSTHTIEVKVFPRSNNYDRIISNYNSGLQGEWILDTYHPSSNNGRSLRFVYVGPGNNSHQVAVANVLTLNTWNHITITFDNGTFNFYVNGISVHQATITESTLPVFNSNSVCFGEDNVIGAPEYLNGKIDEVRFWNVVRTPSEINNNLNKCLNGDEPGLIAYFNFNEGAGNYAYDLVDNKFGMLQNMSGNAWVQGDSINCGSIISPTALNGYALDFDGANDHVKTSFTLASTTTYSIEAWIYPRSGNYDRLISNFKGSGSAAAGEIIIDTYNPTINNGRGIRFVVNGGFVSAPNALTSNAWNHVACVFDNGNLTIYVNGFEVVNGTTTASSHTGIAQSFVFGEDFIQGASEHFNGKMDEVRFWNKALNQTEIMANMNNCLTGSEADLLAYYNFEEGNGITIYDLTAGQNNGVMNNMDETTDWVEGQFACNLGCSIEMTQTVTITPTSIDNSTTQSGNTISTVQAGASYNWLDCDNSFAAVGTTTQDFTPSANGNYAVEITLNGCVDTSACNNITLVGIEQFNTTVMTISPNPVKDVLYINSTAQINQVRLYNINGSLVATLTADNNGKVNVSHLSKGMYFVLVSTDNGISQTKFIKE